MDSKCDILLNNMFASFNNIFLEAREKPIVSMLENIHIYLMERWDTNSKKVVAWEGSVLPNIKKKKEKKD